MKYNSALLVFAALTESILAEKDEKSFSLFNVVSFPNAECKTTLITDPLTSGVCLSAEECNAAGGKDEGNCASGFGVCCYFSIFDTGVLISNNLTHILNVGYPNFYADISRTDQSGTFTYPLESNTDICQIRLDFEDVILAQPIFGDKIGKCGGTEGDTLTVSSPNLGMIGFQSLCGTLTGQHIYIHNSFNPDETVQNTVVVTIALGSKSFDRRWKIKASFIECNNVNRADEGCLQWFTDFGGRIKSFNKLDTMSMMISNLLYSVCIRKMDGMCGMSVSQSLKDSSSASFRLQKNDGTTQNGGVETAYTGGTSCNKEYVAIGDTKYCGGVLGIQENTEPAAIYSRDLPLRINVVTDGSVGNNDRRIENSGFDLIYRQTPCGQ